MLGMSVTSSIAVGAAVILLASLLIAAIMRPKHVRKQREFRRRGLV
ncbi:MAG: hypothetical protein ALAOOOJD_04729 [bacterium]|nr:hypothetical protein [bacterium]